MLKSKIQKVQALLHSTVLWLQPLTCQSYCEAPNSGLISTHSPQTSGEQQFKLQMSCTVKVIHKESVGSSIT